MTPDSPINALRQQERLSADLTHIPVEIRQQQPGQFQAALINNESAHRRRRVRTRVMILAMPRPHTAAKEQNHGNLPDATDPDRTPAPSHRHTGPAQKSRTPSPRHHVVPP